MALGVAGYPVLVYHIAECCCHLGLAASVFLTIAITLERYQVQGYQMYQLQGYQYDITKKPSTKYQVQRYHVPGLINQAPGTKY